MLAPAKINLFLHVGPVQQDGYHPLFSLVGFASCGDVLTCRAADDISLSIESPHRSALQEQAVDDNLVLKAARVLKEWAAEQGKTVPGAALTLEKNLPIASGIGGGSTDAATALHLLMHEWTLSPPQDALEGMALSLGADVPVCLNRKAAYMSGIGQDLEDVILPEDVHLVLVNPGVAVSTAEIFRDFDNLKGVDVLRSPDLPPQFDDLNALIRLLNETRNDLQVPAISRQPIIGDVLDDLDAFGAIISRMSGSGATCFGLFGSAQEAHFCFEKIALKRPQWWVRATTLLPPEV